ncbi:MAG: 5-(carboxyamino)imidazole ribonucleotide synthase [Alphaproteobacteria bacterium]
MNKTLGILGGGQLGRMSALAAARLGISCVIFTPEENSPAAQVAAQTIVANYDDQAPLKKFAALCDTITYEFENIPVETVQFLQTLKPVYPDDKLLNIAQDRLTEKNTLNQIGIPTARFAEINSAEDIRKTLKAWGEDEVIIKTRRFGYDGKGQARILSDTDIDTLWAEFENAPCILEQIIDFDCEISVIIARDINGNSEIYGPMVNEHKNHILHKTTMPCPLANNIQSAAKQSIKTIADHVDLTGVLTLELFVTKSGEILANEIAPRTHNSGHWTIDACTVSQFENHIRTTSALPVAPATRHSDCEMLNLIGNDASAENIEKFLTAKNTALHLYGKSQIRKGRKMGHVTVLK